METQFVHEAGSDSDDESSGEFRVQAGRLIWDDHQFALMEGDNFVGRDDQCEVVINHTSVSAKHALIRLLRGNASVTDLRSVNGTTVVSGGRTTKLGKRDREFPLETDDTVYFGQVKCTVEFFPSSNNAAAFETQLVRLGETQPLDIAEAGSELPIRAPVRSEPSEAATLLDLDATAASSIAEEAMAPAPSRGIVLTGRATTRIQVTTGQGRRSNRSTGSELPTQMDFELRAAIEHNEPMDVSSASEDERLSAAEKQADMEEDDDDSSHDLMGEEDNEDRWLDSKPLEVVAVVEVVRESPRTLVVPPTVQPSEDTVVDTVADTDDDISPKSPERRQSRKRAASKLEGPPPVADSTPRTRRAMRSEAPTPTPPQPVAGPPPRKRTARTKATPSPPAAATASSGTAVGIAVEGSHEDAEDGDDPIAVMFTKLEESAFSAQLRRLSGMLKVVSEPSQATHIITTAELKRTPKLLMALSSRQLRYIVTEKWLEDSARARRPLEVIPDTVTRRVNQYLRSKPAEEQVDSNSVIYRDYVAALNASPFAVRDADKEALWQFSMAETLARVRFQPVGTIGVLGNCSVFITRGVCGESAPSAAEMRSIVEAGGGRFCDLADECLGTVQPASSRGRRRAQTPVGLEQQQEDGPRQRLIISHPNVVRQEVKGDLPSRARKAGVRGVHSVETIFRALLRQQADWNADFIEGYRWE